jgi:hypothetical protein
MLAFLSSVGILMAQNKNLPANVDLGKGWAETAVPQAPPPIDDQQRSLRAMRSSTFNDNTHSKAPLDSDSASEATVQGMSVYHVRLEPLPASISDTIILGQVVGYQPYLSADHTTVYTELKVTVEKIFKNRPGTVDPSTTISIPRIGGTVQLPTGRTVRQFVPHAEQALDIGGKYVLFLNYNHDLQWFDLVKAWRLDGDSVTPTDTIDAADVERGKSSFRNMNKSQFLQQVEAAASRPSSQ